MGKRTEACRRSVLQDSTKRKLVQLLLNMLGHDDGEVAEAQERRLSRLASKRLSASRTRDRMQAACTDLQLKIALATHHNACIASHTAEVEACNVELRQGVCAFEAKWREALASHERLLKTLRSLETDLRVTLSNNEGRLFRFFEGAQDLVQHSLQHFPVKSTRASWLLTNQYASGSHGCCSPTIDEIDHMMSEDMLVQPYYFVHHAND